MDNFNMVKQLEMLGIDNKDILNAMTEVQREFFVGERNIDYAYMNTPLPLSSNQTISQPYTVAFMLELLELKPDSKMKVLEIGTGSGWNAVLIAKILGKNSRIITIERIKELHDFAKENFNRYIRYKRNMNEDFSDMADIDFIYGDASKGYEKQAPYDRIIFTCSVPHIEDIYIDQLKDNGILVAPVGRYEQEIIKLIKRKDKIEKENYGGFVFVPLKESVE